MPGISGTMARAVLVRSAVGSAAAVPRKINRAIHRFLYGWLSPRRGCYQSSPRWLYGSWSARRLGWEPPSPRRIGDAIGVEDTWGLLYRAETSGDMVAVLVRVRAPV